VQEICCVLQCLKFHFACYLKYYSFFSQIFKSHLSHFLRYVFSKKFYKSLFDIFQSIFNLPLLNTFIPLMIFLLVRFGTETIN